MLSADAAAGHFKERDRAPQSRGVDRRDASVGSRAFVDHVRWRRRVGACALTPRPARIPPHLAATKTRLFFSNHDDPALTSLSPPPPPSRRPLDSSRPAPTSLTPTAIRRRGLRPIFRRRVCPGVRRGVYPGVRRGTRRGRVVGACQVFLSSRPRLRRSRARRSRHLLTFFFRNALIRRRDSRSAAARPPRRRRPEAASDSAPQLRAPRRRRPRRPGCLARRLRAPRPAVAEASSERPPRRHPRL